MKGGISPCSGRNVPADLQVRISELFASGHDTLDISRICKLRERAVCLVLEAQQDARYALRQQEAQRA